MMRIREADYSDYGFLTAIFNMGNRAHVDMRPDLYRLIDTGLLLPRWRFAVAVYGQQFEHFPFKTGHNNLCILIAEEDGKPVGVVVAVSEPRPKMSWSMYSKQAYVENVIVQEEYRRRGIASKLLQEVRKWAKETGHEYIHAKVQNMNEKSLGLFAKAGFFTDSSNVGMHL